MGDGATARRMYEDAVEYLCRNIDALRPLIGPEAWEASFAVVRDGDPRTVAWRNAVRALHHAAAAEIPGGLGLTSTMGVGDWPSGPTEQSVGWVCPTDRCARVDLRGGATAPETPTCALTGRSMRLVGG
ncbi:hypothetical protein [Streptomyces sp. NPDC058249]|uniref:hypothetical protein n=1 Tax=Streptomyces sp. NPDC058249 TaxID=3346403 RepID=UPI0036E2D967